MRSFNNVEVLNIDDKEFFSGIVANPGEVGVAHAPQLKAMIELYPQSSILRALLARSIQADDPAGFQQRLKSAAVYAPDKAILYNLINYPERLTKYNYGSVSGLIEETDALSLEGDQNINGESSRFNGLVEEPAYQTESVNYFHEPEESQPEPGTTQTDTPAGQDDQALPPIPGYNKPGYEEELLRAAPKSEIDDEVYDEITGIEDIYIKPVNYHTEIQPMSPVVNPPHQLEDILLAQYGAFENIAPVIEQQQPPQAMYPLGAPGPVKTIEPEKKEEYSFSASKFKDRMEATTDDEVEFEMVDETVKEQETEPEKSGKIPPILNKAELTRVILNKPVTPPPAPEPAVDDDDARLSKYNDDKMPYSFMWWLDKTRKEHAETHHQPYVAFKPVIQELPRPVAKDELQQQYFENIFHLTSVEQLDIHTRGKRKESEIIDRFIQQDPQLKPPNTEKLDNENKARKSSEDEDALVSETLARIYVDQMLYNKAIVTYQKLMLKFPEKSSYFVAQIKLLEKKIN